MQAKPAPSASSVCRVLQPSQQPNTGPSSLQMYLLSWGTPDWTQCSRCCPASAVQGGMISFLHLLTILLLRQPTMQFTFFASKADCGFVPNLLFTRIPTHPFLQSCSLASQSTACTNTWCFSVSRAGLWSGSCQPIPLASQDPYTCSLCLLLCVNLHSDASYKSFMRMFNSFRPALDTQGMALIAAWQLDF